MKKQKENDKHKPDLDALIEISDCGDYGVLYILCTVIATICVLLFLIKAG